MEMGIGMAMLLTLTVGMEMGIGMAMLLTLTVILMLAWRWG